MRQSMIPHAYSGKAFHEVHPWDYGGPQPEFMCIAAGGEFEGSVLDVECGTGENALLLASQGHEVLGIDRSARLIGQAKSKAARRRVEATFRVFDPQRLSRLGRTFDTVVDGGYFHLLTNAEREGFVRSLAAVLRSGGGYHMLCLSEMEPYWGGPRRVTQREIRAAFSGGWHINYIRDAMMLGRLREGRARAWLSSITLMDGRRTH